MVQHRAGMSCTSMPLCKVQSVVGLSVSQRACESARNSIFLVTSELFAPWCFSRFPLVPATEAGSLPEMDAYSYPE